MLYELTAKEWLVRARRLEHRGLAADLHSVCACLVSAQSVRDIAYRHVFSQQHGTSG